MFVLVYNIVWQMHQSAVFGSHELHKYTFGINRYISNYRLLGLSDSLNILISNINRKIYLWLSVLIFSDKWVNRMLHICASYYGISTITCFDISVNRNTPFNSMIYWEWKINREKEIKPTKINILISKLRYILPWKSFYAYCILCI